MIKCYIIPFNYFKNVSIIRLLEDHINKVKENENFDFSDNLDKLKSIDI